MDESEDNASAEDIKMSDSFSVSKSKPKKRSLVERELETHLTARVTSPVTNSGTSTSRYGRARRLKTDLDFCDTEKAVTQLLKSPKNNPSPIKIQSPVYKMHASNSPLRSESSKRLIKVESNLENQIENIYQENILLSRFSAEEPKRIVSPAKKFSKVYVRKDLIQKNNKEETVTLMKNIFSPVRNAHKSTNTHLNNILERSSDKYNLNDNTTAKTQNGHLNMSSVVKTLNFDSDKKKKDSKSNKTISKSDLFELEAKCPYQVGDLAWARVGTYPFWPCIVTREPHTDTFVKKKLFGRVEHDVIHVTFFGDNGRRGWIVDNMLRKYLGLSEFENTREKFTPEAKKRDPRLYAAFFVSDKKQGPWRISVDEAEILLREPKRLRIDILNEMIEKSRAAKTTPKREKSGKITRTDSDVSLSESLCDTLFSEDDGKVDDFDRSGNKYRTKSLDVSEVVTACLDNMAARTGITRIQRQSHMDRWLQKAKSKTPEKSQPKVQVSAKKSEKVNKNNSAKKKNKISLKCTSSQKPYSFRRSINESQNILENSLSLYQNEHDYSSQDIENHSFISDGNDPTVAENLDSEEGNGIGFIVKVESLYGKLEEDIHGDNECAEQNDIITTIVNDDFIITEPIITEPVTTEETGVKETNVTCTISLNSQEVQKTDLNKIDTCSLDYTVLPIEDVLKQFNNTKFNMHKQPETENTSISEDKDDIMNIAERESDDKTEEHNVIVEDMFCDKLHNAILIDKIGIIEDKIGIINLAQCESNGITKEHTDVVKDILCDEANKDVIINKVCIKETKDDNHVLNDTFSDTKYHKDIVLDKGCDIITHANQSFALTEENATMDIDEEDVTESNIYSSKASPDDVSDFKNTLGDAENHVSVDKSCNKNCNLFKDNDLIEKENIIYVTDSNQVLEGNTNKYKTDICYEIKDHDNLKEIQSDLHEDNNEMMVSNKKTANNNESNIMKDILLDNQDIYQCDEYVENNLDEKTKQKVTNSPKMNDKNAECETSSSAEIQNKNRIIINDYKKDQSDISEITEKYVLKINDRDNFTNTCNDKKSDKIDVFKDICQDYEIKQNGDDELLKTSKVSDNDIMCLNGVYDSSENLLKKEICHKDVIYQNGDHELLETSEEMYLDGVINHNGDRKFLETSKEICCNDVVNQNGDHESFSDMQKNDNNIFKYEKITKSIALEEISNGDVNTSLKNCMILNKDDQIDINDTYCDQNIPPIEEIKQNGDINNQYEKKHEKVETEITAEILNSEINHVKDDDVMEHIKEIEITKEPSEEIVTFKSEDSEVPVTKCILRSKGKQTLKKDRKADKVDVVKALQEPGFVNYMELRQDALLDENPELSQDDLIAYIYETWLYKESIKSDREKEDDIEQANLVKGLNEVPPLQPKKIKNKTKDRVEKKTQDISNSEVKFLKDAQVTGDENKIKIKEELESETASINSEDSDISLNKRKLRSKEKHILKYFMKSNEIDVAKALQEQGFVCYMESRKDALLKENPEFSQDGLVTYLYETWLNEESIKSDRKINDHIEQANVIKGLDKDSLPQQEKEIVNSEVNLLKDNQVMGYKKEVEIKEEFEAETASINSEDSGISVTKRKLPLKEKQIRHNYKESDKVDVSKALQEPGFVNYMELKQDALLEENPELSQHDLITYLYKTWLYEESIKSDRKKNDVEQINLIKGLNKEPPPQQKKIKKKIKVEKDPIVDVQEIVSKEKPKRKIVKPYYNEDFSDIEDQIELFEIFRRKSKTTPKPQVETVIREDQTRAKEEAVIEVNEFEDQEVYFYQLTTLKPNIFKGLIREKVCDICEKPGSLVKCKGCHAMFHPDCVKKETEVVEVQAPIRGRKKKKKTRRRKPKGFEDSILDTESQSDEKSQASHDANVSDEIQNMSVDDIIDSEPHIVADAENFESQLAVKMKEILENSENIEYDSYTSEGELDWSDTVAGKCEIIDIKPKLQNHNTIDTDYSNFKCNNCQKYDIPVCFVCKSALSPKNQTEYRQRCQVAQCHKYYHLECLDHWPQTQFNSGELSRVKNEYFEAISCPRHVCHTCVCDDPRGCKTRFSGDKLARCVRCPATYHTFTKCLPAGTQILTGSHIICPRHYEHRPGKVPCHVNTGWCFICALGGTLICCEFCPTSFHAECLNIKPPEGSYMCEDCETGRLPLYGEMVWVKLGHYRWWPGIILHPCEIPDNIMAVKHSPGEFVVRFFGQYDYYWVNRGRVFPFQEGDSGRISSQKSKIDAAFTKAMEHAQRACEILKSVENNEEEDLDIASSLLPPHYIKLKVNKPCGAVATRRVDLDENSLTQCECDPDDEEPCGPYTHCLNRMLLTECGPTCRAGDRCNNRAFEKRLYPKLVPYRTPHRGWGLKTLENIRQGQFVIEYVGELIDEEEFKRRMRRKHEMRDENFYFLTLDKERMIDAGPKGNLARFMNHCCEPNCETQKWTVLGDVRVGLFALHDIPANSEVTFNYNLECAGIEKKRCLCGAKRCSGYIGAKPKQDESQSKKPKIPAKRVYKKRKNIEDSPSTSKSKPTKSKHTQRPAKPKELTEIEKDLLIIKSATNGISSDSECSGRLSSIESDRNRNSKPLKRKRVSFSTEEVIIYNSGSNSPSVKRVKLDEEKASNEVGD